MLTLYISHQQLERLGDMSIQGLLMEKGLYGPNDDKKITVVFQERDQLECNPNGPDSVMIPEYVVRCVAESLLALAAKGYDVKLNTAPHREFKTREG